MTASQDEATGMQEHVPPREAWDAIADGYDRYVAPQEVDLASEALRLVGLVARDDRALRGARPRGGPEQRSGAGDGLPRARPPRRPLRRHGVAVRGSCSCPSSRARSARWFA